MNLLGRKEATPEPAEITGTMALRMHLERHTRGGSGGRSYTRIASDINDTMTEAANRAAAKAIAARMAPDADEVTLRGIAASLPGGMARAAGAVATVTGQMLEDFAADRSDLPAAIKSALASLLHGGFATFDAEIDRLRSTASAPVAFPVGCIPEPWQHPDARVRETHAAYVAALQAYNGPPPMRTARTAATPHTEPAKLKPRPGWA